MKFSLETVCKIWNDECGERLEVGPDRDGLGLLEIRSFTSDGKINASVTMPKEQALVLFQALGKLLDK